MDAIDKKILELLQKNGRMTVKEITQTISLTAPAVSERIKRLEKDGVIEGYTAIVNPRQMGRTVHAIINVSIQPSDTEKLLSLVSNEPMVVQCYHVTGAYSYLIKVDAYEIGDLEKLIMKFQKMGETSTQIILSTPISRKEIL
ncbi:MAG: Lrp/AsnC family transcriptional regulator [Oscillospiraceae bacterium]